MAAQRTALAAWIVSNRKRLGWKSETLASKLREAGYEAAETTVRTWESGRRPKPDTIEGMERLFDSVAPDDRGESEGLAAALFALTDELRAAREERQEMTDRVEVLESLVKRLYEQAIADGSVQPARRASAG